MIILTVTVTTFTSVRVCYASVKLALLYASRFAGLALYFPSHGHWSSCGGGHSTPHLCLAGIPGLEYPQPVHREGWLSSDYPWWWWLWLSSPLCFWLWWLSLPVCHCCCNVFLCVPNHGVGGVVVAPYLDADREVGVGHPESLAWLGKKD